MKKYWREVRENSVSSTDPTVREVTDESYTMTVEKFKTKAFKKFAARRQQAYLHNNLRNTLKSSNPTRNQVEIPLIVNPVLALQSDVNY